MPEPLVVRWHSHAALRSVVPGPGAALVLVADPGFRLMQPHRFDTVLDLQFFDARKLDLLDKAVSRIFGGRPALAARARGVFRNGMGWPWRPPHSADAVAVGRFLRSLPASTREIHVSCNHGMSRSRCIAEWIASAAGVVPEGRMDGSENPILARLLVRHGGSPLPSGRSPSCDGRGSEAAVPG